MVSFLLYIWQLPQHILALIIKFIHRKEIVRTTKYNKLLVYIIPSWNSWGAGVSLGNYILLAPNHCNLTTVKHEHGHQIQSRILGWLYLLVVGFTSAICNNLWDRLFHKKWTTEKRNEWYYNRFPEKWADKLGKVNRFKKI